MELVDDVSRYYDARAPFYDETAGYTNPETERLRAPMKARCRETFAGHAVLEIACGTGYWTEVVAQSAGSVLATDINPSVISRATDRCGHRRNVRFQTADAFTLDGVAAGFTAAFAFYWWSHVPRERIAAFSRHCTASSPREASSCSLTRHRTTGISVGSTPVATRWNSYSCRTDALSRS